MMQTFSEFFASAGSLLLTLFTFLVIFGILIILHEFGHFWAARAAKVKVLEFGFGMPPKILGKKTIRKTKNDANENEEMEWTLNAIPFGGFVRMEGEEGNSSHPNAFDNRPLAWRMLVICGGVIMNFLLGWGLLTIAFTAGVQSPDMSKIEIVNVPENMPAFEAGLKKGDIITKINETEITSSGDFLNSLDASKTAEITVLRNNTEKTISVTANNEGKFGIGSKHPLIIEQYGFLESAQHAFFQSFVIMKSSIDAIGNLVTSIRTHHEIPSEIGGPVAIAEQTDLILEYGTFLQLVLFTATLSLSLAVLNIMPFPGLDGGRFIFLLIEALFLFFHFFATKILKIQYNFPTRLPHSLELYINALGMLTLFAFLLWITFLDIGKLLG